MILGFLDKLKAQCIKEKIDKPDFIKIKNFSSKDTIKKMQKISHRFALISDNGLAFRIYKSLSKLNNKKWANDLKRYFSQRRNVGGK